MKRFLHALDTRSCTIPVYLEPPKMSVLLQSVGCADHSLLMSHPFMYGQATGHATMPCMVFRKEHKDLPAFMILIQYSTSYAPTDLSSAMKNLLV